MRAIEITQFGSPEVLKPTERKKPEPGDGELVIQVKAAGVARADTLQRQGKYPPPPGASDIPGLDVAGSVDSVGNGVSGFQRGDRVCAILTGGGYAEYCAAPIAQVLPVPEGWSDVEAATLPENLFTVFDNLITRAGLQDGETVLIHGGTSGIGSMALMLAQTWGARAISTAGTAEKCRACLQFGAEEAVNYREDDFVARVRDWTNGRGVDVVLDLVGGPYLERNLDALATEGRLTIVATQGGRMGELNIAKLMAKRGRIMGSTMRVRTAAQKGEIKERLLKQVWPLLPGKKTIRPLIDSTFPLTEARKAHERMESGSHIGKIVLMV